MIYKCKNCKYKNECTKKEEATECDDFEFYIDIDDSCYCGD